MRGLIYKDFSIFYKCIDKKVIAIAVGFTALLIFSAGNYGGLMASIMFAMTVGMQNIISLAGDERAGWKKYQRVLPMSGFSVVASKYISVLLTLGISLLGSIVFNLLSGVISGSFDPAVWGLFRDGRLPDILSSGSRDCGGSYFRVVRGSERSGV